MTDNDARSAGPDSHVNFRAPAVLRKWPSLNNQRCTDGTSAYLVIEGTLDECIGGFMAKPESTRHLYEIQTARRPPFVTETLSADYVAELARLREFL